MDAPKIRDIGFDKRRPTDPDVRTFRGCDDRCGCSRAGLKALRGAGLKACTTRTVSVHEGLRTPHRCSGKARQTRRNFIKSAASKPLFGGEALLLSLPTPALLRWESFRGTRAFLGELKEGN